MIPVQYLARFTVPLVIAAFWMQGNGPEQAQLYATMLEGSDQVLSVVNREGEGPTESYDYIIIGAGSAGAILANRLSANPGTSVLLLEAGGDPNPISEVPMFQDYYDVGGMMYDYATVPQENACLSYPASCWFGRGKALGGSSSVNGVVYNRCNAKDYDSWANFTGDPIWEFNNVVDAFRAIETYHGFYVDNPGPNHGTDGPIHVNPLDFLPGYEVLAAALAERGIPTGDLNSGEFPSGFSKLDYNVKDGVRSSTYHGYLEPILGRSNLKIYRYAVATKIHLDEFESRSALGVSYTRHGQSRYAAVNREVIVAAGVVDTPKLLMLSGIGPRQHLTSHGIPTVIDSPAVGTHLQEHIGVRVYPFAVNQIFGEANPLTPENIVEYVKNATGPLANLKVWGDYAIHIANGYFSSQTMNDPTWPDLHTYINELVIATPSGPLEQQFSIELELVRVNQTGTIRLASSNPQDWPLIDPKFLEDPEDVEKLIQGIEYLVDFFLNSTTFQQLGIKWSDNVQRIPECEHIEFATREYWQCYIPQMSHPTLHPTSSCRMGPSQDVAVVDSRLRVFGATGLRVIDSSVMPWVPNGNTNFPSMMIGEMGARILLGEV